MRTSEAGTIEYKGVTYPTLTIDGYLFAEEKLYIALTDFTYIPDNTEAEVIDNQIAFYFEDGELSTKTDEELLTIFKNL